MNQPNPRRASVPLNVPGLMKFINQDTPDPFAGTPFEGVDTIALDEMSEDCSMAPTRLYLIRPIYQIGEGKSRAASGVAFKGCCAGGVTRNAYTRWMPHLKGAIGFLTIDVTDEAP